MTSSKMICFPHNDSLCCLVVHVRKAKSKGPKSAVEKCVELCHNPWEIQLSVKLSSQLVYKWHIYTPLLLLDILNGSILLQKKIIVTLTGGGGRGTTCTTRYQHVEPLGNVIEWLLHTPTLLKRPTAETWKVYLILLTAFANIEFLLVHIKWSYDSCDAHCAHFRQLHFRVHVWSLTY